MGNEHSGGTKSARTPTGDGGSPTTSTGVPTSFSFLAKKRNSTRSTTMTNSIVVVNEATSTQADPSKDADLKRIKEIPRFLPLLRGVLPGYRDPPEVYQKIDQKHMFRFLHRLQQHFRLCAQTVAADQGRTFAHIVEVDQLLSSLLKKTAICSRKMDTLNAELKKMDVIREQLDSTEALLDELVHSTEALNQLLPVDDQLPSLNVAFRPISSMGKRPTRERTKQREADCESAEAAAVDVVVATVSECRVVDRKH